MKHAMTGAVILALIMSLVLAGSIQAQPVSRPDRSTADQAIAAIGLDGNGNSAISFERADFRAGRYTFTDITIRHSIDDPATTAPEQRDRVPEEIQVARMVLDSPRLDDAGNLLLHGFVLEDISARDGRGGFSIDRLELSAPNPAMSADLGRLLRGDGREEIDSNWDLYQFALLAIDALSVTDNAPGEAFTMTLDRLAFIDYTAAALGRLELLGLAIAGEAEGDNMTIGLAELSVDGLVNSTYSSLMGAMASGAGKTELAAAYYGADAGGQMDALDRLELRDLGLVLPGLAVSLDELVITVEERRGVFDSHAHLGSLRLVPDPEAAEGAEFAAAIAMLGYESLDLSLESNSVYDPLMGRFYTRGENFIELRDGLRLDMVQDMGGYLEYLAKLRSMAGQGPLDEAAHAAFLLEALSHLTISRVGLRLEDRSMLERAIATGAANQDITVQEMRAQASLIVGIGLLAAPPQVPRTLLTEAAMAISAFINQGGALRIDIAPPQAVSVGDLMDQSEAGAIDFEALGLSVTAEPPAQR